MAGRVAGRNVLVTGAGGGIGAALAERLAREGASVGVADASAEGAAEVAEAIAARGQPALALTMDVAAEDSIERGVASMESAFGVVDGLVAGAGVISINPFLDVAPQSWQATLGVNLTGTYLALRVVARRLIQRRMPGSVVAIASIAARGPNPVAPDYGVSKAGVVNLIRSAAVVLGPHGIRANAVCPGIIDTRMLRALHEQVGELKGMTGSAALTERVAQVPLGRIGTPEDVAGPIAFLLSDDAAYVNGQALNVCGGLEFD